jgi:hypothetical protein
VGMRVESNQAELLLLAMMLLLLRVALHPQA